MSQTARLKDESVMDEAGMGLARGGACVMRAHLDHSGSEIG